MSVGIVTDSTCYLPTEVVSQLGIKVVPLQVISNGVAFNEVGGITVDEVATALRSGKSVTTSRPNPEVFVEVFEKVHAAGHESIVSVHLSSELSGTYESAVLASRKVDFPVDVVDSRGIAMMLGFAVQAGAKLANSGGSHAKVLSLIQRKCAGASIIFYVDSLEFLEKGGRITAMQAKMGASMNLKPLLHIINGKVEQQELVRSSEKSIARMIEIVSAAARIKSEIAVHHVEAFDIATRVASQLKELTGVESISVTSAGAVVGTHVGPGALAVVVSPQV
jgi:DegV family protein with EDD domain